MDELQNGIQYGVKYHTFYVNCPPGEKRRKYKSGRRFMCVRYAAYIFCMIMVLIICIPQVLKGNPVYIFLLFACLVISAIGFYFYMTNITVLDRCQVWFDEKGVCYTDWKIARNFKTEQVDYSEIGRIYLGDFPMTEMPRARRRYLISPDTCREIFGTYINVVGLGTNVLFSLQYTEERLQFLKDHCKEDLPVLTQEEFAAYRKSVSKNWS